MRKKKAPVKKIQPPKPTKTIQIESVPLHIEFPITLHHKAENKLCFFRDQIDMKKYIERCKLKSDDYKITKTKPKDDG